MKKLHIITLAFLLFIGSSIALPLHAESGKGEMGGQGDNNRGGLFRGLFGNDHRGDKSPDDRGDRKNENAVYGTITAINGTTLTITEKWNNNAVYTVDTTNAKIDRNRSTISISGIVIGDTAVVEGTKNGTSVVATSVHVGAMIKGDMKDDHNFMGTVTAVNGTTISYTNKGPNNTTATYTVNASNATVERNGSTSSVLSIVVGDMIRIQGTLNGTTVTAAKIKVTEKGNPFVFEGNGQPITGGTVTALNGNTITITNKSNVTYTVDATNAKIGKNGQMSTLSNIAVGDSILVQGTVNGNAIVASSISNQGSINTTNNNGQHKGVFIKIRSFFSKLFGF